jgi:EAL domain-containing protein (putative c-di-GMP-specific phosphodiesterase class I)
MMEQPKDRARSVCDNCHEAGDLDFDFTMAFQPIVNCKTQSIFGYEALVRGLNNESAYSIISKVNDDNRYLFDQLCRVKAIALAAKLNIKSMLSINFLPNAIYNFERCIRTTLEAAKKYNFPSERIMFEFTEVEKLKTVRMESVLLRIIKNCVLKLRLMILDRVIPDLIYWRVFRQISLSWIWI